MKPYVCFYHDKCLDGFTSAYIVHRYLGDKCEFIPASYDDPEPDYASLKGKIVYIVDFSFPIEVLRKLTFIAESVIWLDHHKTAIEAYEKQSDRLIPVKDKMTIVLDTERSGAGITWDYCFPDLTMPILVKYIQDWDLWTKKLNRCNDFNAFISAEERSFENWGAIDDNLGRSIYLSECLYIGTHYLRKRRVDMEAHLSSAHPIHLAGREIMACNAGQIYASELGHALAKQHGGVGAVYTFNGKDVKVSLRSIEENDVAAIAKKHGGGGHFHAAGFTMSLVDFISKFA